MKKSSLINKREARSEKREARSEKREARSEKREARSEKILKGWRVHVNPFCFSGFGIRDSGFGIRDSGFGIRDSLQFCLLKDKLSQHLRYLYFYQFYPNEHISTPTAKVSHSSKKKSFP
ncbi:hypothetical protein BWP24_16515 [Vibrio campbellii]|nr:hypothetical protein BWP24_16515 [Vibrio campbellii]